MEKQAFHQLTIRKVSERTVRHLKNLARNEGKSINTVLVEALNRGLGLDGEPNMYHDLDDLAGTWQADPAVDAALESMRSIDPELWK